MCRRSEAKQCANAAAVPEHFQSPGEPSGAGGAPPGAVAEYLQRPDQATATLYVRPHLRCRVCNVPMQRVVDASSMACPSCGISNTFLDSSTSAVGYNDDIEYGSFSYKRQNHFQEWLNAVQGRETTRVPDSVVATVMKDLYNRGLRDPAQVTRADVRQALKTAKLRKYYDNVSSILHTVTGRPPVRLRPDQEEQLKLMFTSIQAPFNRHCPKNRKNFLSYAYVLFKFCELLGLDELLECFRLLKGREKLHKQDVIFEKICEDLNWQFIPSI